MKLPRFSIGSMIFLVMVVGVDFGWAVVIYRPASVFGLGLHYLDMPLLGLFNVLAIVGYPLLAHRAGRPFRVGFVGGGVLCAAAYVAAFRGFGHLGSWALLDVGLPIQRWIIPMKFQPGSPGYDQRLLLAYLAMGVVGLIPLAASSALLGLLNCLVAKGKVPWMVAVAALAILVGSAGLAMRRAQYQEQATRCEEALLVLSNEADDISKELERLRASEGPPDAQREQSIKATEEQLARYQPFQAKIRRELETYRRVVRCPWLSVEE